MKLQTDQIKEIYNGKVAHSYDWAMSHFFGAFKRKAFASSEIKEGDTILVFCCGTGMDFPYILNKIGTTGAIIGVDFSSEMLHQAEKKIKKYNWRNVKLIEADVTKFNNQLPAKADAAVCTLGLSIIPDYVVAYNNLISNVKPGGEIIIGDMQLASGRYARLNPITLAMAKRFGGSYEGHENSLEIKERMKNDLRDVLIKEYFFKSYFFCRGVKKS